MQRFLFFPRPTCRGRRAGSALPGVMPDAGPGSRCVRRPPYLLHNFRTIRASLGYVRPEGRGRQFTPACSSTSDGGEPAAQESDLCTDLCTRRGETGWNGGDAKSLGRRHGAGLPRSAQRPETARDSRDGRRMAHNPEVAGSNPAPATKARGPFSNREGAFRLWFMN
jgi:hypothetical protein